MFCHICERDDVPEWQMNKTGYACAPCHKNYQQFRMAYKAEHGRWPKMKEFRSDE
jgi:hypothetical protein